MSRQSRKKRRQTRAGLKFGRAAYPRHTNRSGRTGTAHRKKPKAKQQERYVAPARTIADAIQCPKCGARPGELHTHR